MPAYQPEQSPRLPLDPVAQSTLDNWERLGYPQIFINYRNGRKDAAKPYYDDMWASVILDNYLSGWFGEAAIFRATRSIPRCAGFPTLLREAAAGCKVFLPIIGVDWRESLVEHPWVVDELNVALQTGKIILPVVLRQETPPPQVHLAGGDIDPLASDMPGLPLGSRNTRQDILEITREIIAHAPGIQIPQPRRGYGQPDLGIVFKS